MVFLDHGAAVAGIQRRADASAQDSVRSACLKFTPKTKYRKSHKIKRRFGEGDNNSSSHPQNYESQLLEASRFTVEESHAALPILSWSNAYRKGASNLVTHCGVLHLVA